MAAGPLFGTYKPGKAGETNVADWLQYTGQSYRDFQSRGYSPFVHPDDLLRVERLLADAAQSKLPLEFDVRVRRRDRVFRSLHVQARPRLKRNGAIKEWVGVLTDVTEKLALQAALRESYERFELATLATRDGIWDLSLSTGEMYYSDHLRELLNLPAAAHSLRDWLTRVYPEDRARLKQQWIEFESSGAAHFEREFRCLDPEGEWRWLRTRAVCRRDADGRILRVTGTACDVSQARSRDPLTGLHNRSSLLEQILWRIQKADQFSRNFALYFLDLDRFKQINDSMGHASGDAVLVEVARRLEATMTRTAGNIVGRLGGDEFVVLVSDLQGEEDAWSYALLLKELLSAPISLSHPLTVTASIGIAFGTGGRYTRAEEIVEEADMAMYSAKVAHKGRIDMYRPAMREAAVARMHAEQHIYEPKASARAAA